MAFLFFFRIPVKAMNTVVTKIPVTMAGEKGRVVIEEIADAPSPESNELYIEKNASDSFVFQFDEPNTYTYSIHQDLSNADSRLIYDEKTYECRIDIFVENDELKSVVSIYEKGSKEKIDELVFENKLPPAPTPKPPTENIDTGVVGYEPYVYRIGIAIASGVILKCLKSKKRILKTTA